MADISEYTAAMAEPLPDYPHEFPVQSAGVLFDIVRNNAYVARRRELVKHGLWFTQYGAYLWVGEPEQVFAAAESRAAEFSATEAAAFDAMTDKEKLEAFGQLAADPEGADGTMAALPIPTSLLVRWLVKFILKHLSNAFE